MEIRFAQSARRHRIGTARVRAVLAAVGEPERIPAQDGESADRLLWVGLDNRGMELEVIGIETEDGSVLIIHAMPTHFRRRRT